MKDKDRVQIPVPDVVINNYKNISGTSLPEDYINPADKDDAWTLRWMNAVLNQHFIGGSTMVPWANQNYIYQKRAYLNGAQSVDRYYPVLFGSKASSNQNALNERLGVFRSSWKIMSLIPAAVDYLKGEFLKSLFTIQARSQNPFAEDERSLREFKMLANTVLPAEYRADAEMAGVVFKENEYAANQRDIELIKELGGLKLPEEFAAEMAIDHIIKHSNFDEVRDKCVEDIITDNIFILEDVLDPFSGKVSIDYFDYANFIGLSDSKGKTLYCGGLKTMLIKDVRAMIRSRYGEGHVFNERILADCARLYEGVFNNRLLLNDQGYRFIERRQMYSYDNYMVVVADLDYLTHDIEKNFVSINGSGKKRMNRVKAEDWGKYSKTENPDVIETVREYYYRGMIVLGTNIVLASGKCRDQRRPSPTSVQPRFHVKIRLAKPLIDRMIPIADDMAVDYFKYENDRARALPPSLAVSKSSITYQDQAGNNVSEAEALDLMIMSGKIFYEDIIPFGNTIMNRSVPVKEIPGGMGAVLQEYQNKLVSSINTMREVLNIRPIDVGPRVTNGVASLGQSQNLNSISSYIEMFQAGVLKAASGAYVLLKTAIKHNKDIYQGYYPIFGRSAVEVMKLTAGVNLEAMGFFLTPLPNESEVQQYMQEIQAIFSGGQSGQPYLDPFMYFMMREAISQGKMSRLKVMLIHWHEKKNKIAQIMSERNAAIQDQVIKSQIMAKTESEIMVMREKAKLDIAVYREKKKADLETEISSSMFAEQNQE